MSNSGSKQSKFVNTGRSPQAKKNMAHKNADLEVT